VTLLSVVTDTEFCYFDVDTSMPGQQFRLVFTPYMNTFKLSASNPGQFYYNVFYTGTAGGQVTLTISIPYPFVTQGANPIHVYSEVGQAPCQCGGMRYTQIGELSGFEISGPDGTTMPGYLLYTVSGTVPSSGLVYVTVHVDYGLKPSYGYTKSPELSNPILIDAKSPTNTIVDETPYDFSYSSGGIFSEPTIYNENVFKKDPGIAGLVERDDGTPIKDVQVNIQGGGTKATVYTDEDGWYMWAYKYTGKPTTFKVTLPAYGVSKDIQVKSNAFVEVDFGGVAAPLHLMSISPSVSAGAGSVSVLAAIAAMMLSIILVVMLGVRMERNRQGRP
jgi:hypothetical protein